MIKKGLNILLKGKWITAGLKRIPLLISVISFIIVIFDLGFDQTDFFQDVLFYFYIFPLTVAFLSISSNYLSKTKRPSRKVWIFDLALLLFIFAVFLSRLNWDIIPLFSKKGYLYLAIFFIMLREFSLLAHVDKNFPLNPAQIFILSFLSIIAIGTLLLMLPNSSHAGISFINALFTSTSAVCVTGLIVVDTGTYFTQFGQIIIVILIQIGGLGIMTFTSYFSYFFKGGATFQNQILLKEMTNSEKLADVFKTLKKIILITFLIEGLGALLIFININNEVIKPFDDRVFFSIFHSVSGFCNAGFSTLSNSLYEIGFRFNYSLHLIIASLFIVGGIGFPILFNFYRYLKHLVIKGIYYFIKRRKDMNIPWIINLNTRIVLLTTLFLIVLGTIGFYVLEYSNTLAEHQGFGKIVTAFFGAVTPRTAGFNSVDTSALNYSTLLFIIFLMWIGASPGSTGGGVKTSTFAIGLINIVAMAKGKKRLEFLGREIAEISVKRSFAIMSLSIMVIGFSVFLVSLVEKDIRLMSIVFECFSAFSTVGLSHGITAELSSISKIIIIITIFVGRVSMLTVLIAFYKKVSNQNYRYPSEEILIN